MSFSHDDIGMTADEQFLSRLGHPDRPIFFIFFPLHFSGISKFNMLCTHLKVTTCKLALYRLTVSHLQERGRWETKHFMGMTLSAPQTPPAIAIEVGTFFLINSFLYFKQNEEVLS